MVGILIFCVTLFVYYNMLCPTVWMIDSGELVVACKDPGVAHPPGFPLYVLIGHLFTKLPFQNLAMCVNFMSAFFGALTCTVTFFTMRLLLPERNNLTLFVSIVAALAFGFSYSLANWATVTEVYTLSIFLVALVFLFMIKWIKTGKSIWIYLAAFSYGLGLANHHITMVVSATPFILFIGITYKGFDFVLSKNLFVSIVIIFITSSILYSFLVVTSNADPYLNWGEPKDFDRLMYHFTGRQYYVFLSSEKTPVEVGKNLEMAITAYFQQFTVFGLAILVPGIWFLWKKDSKFLVGGIIVIVFTYLYRINMDYGSDGAPDWLGYLLPAFFVTALWIGYGVYAIFQAVKKDKLLYYGSFVVFLMFPVAVLMIFYKANDRSKFFVARDFAMNALQEVEPNSIIITDRWLLHSPIMYLQHCENVKKDVLAIDYSFFQNRSWYFTHLEKYHKEFYLTIEKEALVFSQLLENWRKELLTDPAKELTEPFKKILNALISRNINNRPIYITTSVIDHFKNFQINVGDIVPRGLLFRLYPAKTNDVPQLINWNLRGVQDDTFHHDLTALEVKKFYILMGLKVAISQKERGVHQLARHTINKVVLKLDPHNPVAYQLLNELSPN